ncbi:MAG: nickel-dependent hydrogenase large subunit, partial [Pontibacterium sp.]
LQQVQAQWPTQDSHGINSHDKARDYIGVQPTPALSKVDNRENAGLGALTTARGLLVHYAHVVDGKVNGYRIVAPTEWNFHPQGSVHALLKGAHIPSGNLAQVVKHVVALIDPCVEYHVTVKAT